MTTSEERVRLAADTLGSVQRESAAEYARLRALGQSSWDAQRGVDEFYAIPLRRAEAGYEIALEALRRERCP